VSDKKEFQQGKIYLERQVSDMENERNESFKTAKVSEERLKLGLEEHTKALAKMKLKFETKINELESQLSETTS